MYTVFTGLLYNVLKNKWEIPQFIAENAVYISYFAFNLGWKQYTKMLREQLDNDTIKDFCEAIINIVKKQTEDASESYCVFSFLIALFRFFNLFALYIV